MKKKPQNQGLNIATVLAASKIFEEKGWEKIDDPQNLRSPFIRFCNMLEKMHACQKDMVLKLTRDYLIITSVNYRNHIRKTLDKVNSNTFDQAKNIFVLPMRENLDTDSESTDRAKIKGCSLVTYMFKEHDLLAHNKLYNKKIYAVPTLAGIPRHIASTENLILFVDDFIGTGETAKGALTDLHSKMNIPKEKIVIFSLVGQKNGVEQLQKLGYECFVGTSINKGISEKFIGEEKESMLSFMETLENELSELKPNCRFGYKGSEALVTMARTPNNTFPIYWLKDKDGDGAPFER